MRALIDGLRYDTDSAEEVARAASPRDAAHLCYYDEGLYVSGNGSWFLAGSGNAATKYASPFGHYLGGGERIIPLQPRDARSWLEFHGLLELLEAHFPGEVRDA
jgi:hypothetical protein